MSIVFLPLTQGEVAVIDFEDFEKVRGINWHAHTSSSRTVYARSWDSVAKKHISLHRYLLGAALGQLVDHEDGDGRNCTRKNLRLCTMNQNMHGVRRKQKGTTSKFVGVYWYSPRNKWKAGIKVDTKAIYLGLYDSEIEAARAYNTAALVRDPKFRNLNKV